MSKIYFTIGILCFLIPLCMQIHGDREQQNVIATYEKYIEECGTEELENCYDDALLYNKSQGNDYEKQLNLAGTGMMGNLEIPKINLRLPIYHGTDENVLANGVGHIKETSLPVGGEGCHAVLTGHCGLPSAELFTRLDELEEGDQFLVRVCNRVLNYEVIRVLVVKPEDVSAIENESEKDLMSLVTCTPYGINTHRLIVTGERTKDIETGKIEAVYTKVGHWENDEFVLEEAFAKSKIDLIGLESNKDIQGIIEILKSFEYVPDGKISTDAEIVEIHGLEEGVYLLEGHLDGEHVVQSALVTVPTWNEHDGEMSWIVKWNPKIQDVALEVETGDEKHPILFIVICVISLLFVLRTLYFSLRLC